VNSVTPQATSGATSEQMAGGLVGATLGNYQIQALLGVGGMAEVYRARDLKLHRQVAVKVLKAPLATDQGYVERFRNEARQVAALNHPHIVPVYAFGEGKRVLYLVMPILPQSLRDRLDRERSLLPPEAVRVITQIASALAVAHAHGLVHRDVKPENVLLNEMGEALLTDFGIARRIDFRRTRGTAQTLSATGLPVGTPEYMAPEQLRGEPVDQRADIYALGAVLYELLTGRAPHEAETPYEVAALALMAPVTPPSARNPRVWPELEQVILTALARTPDERYANVRSFAEALQEAAISEGKGLLTGPLGLTRPATFAPLPQPSTVEEVTAAAGASPAPVPPHVADAPTQPPESAVEIRGTSRATNASNAWPLHPMVLGRHLRQKLSETRRPRLMLLVALALLVAMIWGGSSLVMLHLDGAIQAGKQSRSSPARNTATLTSGGIIGGTATTSTGGPAPSPVGTPARPTATLPPPLSISTFAWSSPSKGMCDGTQTLTSTGEQALNWQWQSSAPNLPVGFSYQINGSPWSSGMPQHTHVSSTAGHTDTLAVALPCDGQSYRVTVVDALGRQYTVRMDVPEN
jgi:serine/threonine protein kinase